MYRKIVQTGTLLEIYTYEYEPNPIRRKIKKRKYYNRFRYTRNVQRARNTFFRLVRANTSPSTPPAFLTLTMREVCTLKEGWRAFTLFGQRLRRQLGQGQIRYICVPEFQERGAVHFHLLVWGLSDEEIAGERITRRIAQLWSHGFCDIRATDGSPKLATYVGKYMFKGLYDDRTRGCKLYSATRNLVRSVSIKMPAAVAQIEDMVGGLDPVTGEVVDKPLLPEKEISYKTKWLGRCDYKSYNFDSI